MSMVLCFSIPTLLSFFRGSRRLANVNMLFLLIVSDSFVKGLANLMDFAKGHGYNIAHHGTCIKRN